MKNEYLGVIFTNHAIKRLYHREISQQKAYKTIKNPQVKKMGKTKGSYKFSRDFGDYFLQLIAKKNDKGQWVVLTCWIREKWPLKTKQGFLARLLKYFLG